MAEGVRKGENQKLKLLYLVDLFLKETDEEHYLTLSEITEKLEERGVNVDRKTLYNDFEELRKYGLDIQSFRSKRKCYYHVVYRDFELPELKLLVDSVQSAKFITEKKSQELIKKIESLASRYDAKKLQRQVIITGRIKTENETIYYNVDTLHEAIEKESQVQFQYCSWNLNKELEPRKNGDLYTVSPWALMWDDENYYLIAYDSRENRIKHYRVDKMLHVEPTRKKREGLDEFNQFNLPQYTKSLFGMFAGQKTLIDLEADNECIGILIDRFGKDIPVIPVSDTRFRTQVNVALSAQFLGWIFSLGDGVQITGPDVVVEQMKEEIRRLYLQYK